MGIGNDSDRPKGGFMLLKGYTKRIFRAECNPNFESLHGIAQLVAEGAKGPEDCLSMGEEARQRLGKYLSAFKKIDPEADKVY